MAVLAMCSSAGAFLLDLRLGVSRTRPVLNKDLFGWIWTCVHKQCFYLVLLRSGEHPIDSCYRSVAPHYTEGLRSSPMLPERECSDFSKACGIDKKYQEGNVPFVCQMSIVLNVEGF